MSSRETYLDAFSAALFGARLNDTIGVPEIARPLVPCRADPSTSPAADLLLDGLVALTDDYETGIPLCRDALQKLSGDGSSPKERLRWLWQGCVVALELWDDDSAYFPPPVGDPVGVSLLVTSRPPGPSDVVL